MALQILEALTGEFTALAILEILSQALKVGIRLSVLE